MGDKRATRVLLLATLIWLVTFGSNQVSQASQIVSGSENTTRTNRLTSEIRWHRSMAQAQEDARRAGKLVFWVNMLGTLSGAT